MRIGIDLGGTKTEGILLDDAGQEVHRVRFPTPAADGYQAIIKNIGRIHDELADDAGQECTIGIGTPGGISPVTGLIRNANTVCLNGKPLQEDIEKELGQAVRLENDANCFTLSEATDGAAAGHGVVFGVIMGTGVGGGWVIDGRLHVGRQFIGGEWGHNILVSGGRTCYCGHRGCVETCLSGPGILASWPDHETAPADVPELLDMYRQGHPEAISVVEEFLELYGRALAGVINIMDPDIVVLGGGLSNIPELYEQGRNHVEKYVFNDSFSTPIVCNQHGDSSGVRGAAWLWDSAP